MFALNIRIHIPFHVWGHFFNRMNNIVEIVGNTGQERSGASNASASDVRKYSRTTFKTLNLSGLFSMAYDWDFRKPVAYGSIS